MRPLLVFAAGFAAVFAQGIQDTLAEKFFQEGDYYRAATEYERLALENPELRDIAILRSAESLVAGGYSAEAIRLLSYPWPDTFRDRRIFLTGQALFAENPQRAAEFLYHSSSEVHQREGLLLLVSQRALTQPQIPKSVFQALQDLTEQHRQQTEYRNELKSVDAEKLYSAQPCLNKRNPFFPALLNAALPGTGYAMYGKWGTGITALLAVGAPAILSMAAFANDEPVTGGVLAGISLLFYGGNVYGGWREAEVYNTTKREQFSRELLSLRALYRFYSSSD